MKTWASSATSLSKASSNRIFPCAAKLRSKSKTSTKPSITRAKSFSSRLRQEFHLSKPSGLPLSTKSVSIVPASPSSSPLSSRRSKKTHQASHKSNKPSCRRVLTICKPSTTDRSRRLLVLKSRSRALASSMTPSRCNMRRRRRRTRSL